MGLVPYLLIAAGFLSGAYVTALDETHVDWAWFAPALAVGALGVWLLRRARHLESRSDEMLAANRSSIDESLGRIIERLADLEAGKEAIPPWELRFEIDSRFRHDLTTFADARESLGHIYGLQAYADIMSAFAAGERYLNRVWSASADGYAEEARTYVTKALAQFNDAREKLEAAEAATPT